MEYGRPSVIERALILAASGKYENADKVRRALKREGYTQVEAYISHSIARQVGDLCRTSFAQPVK